MAIKLYRHIHTGQLIVLREKTYAPNWIRRTTVDFVADIARSEVDSFDNSYVDMCTSIIVERPGTPPIAGVACETVFPQDEDETTRVTLYYYSWPEIKGDTLHLEMARPNNTYHADEQIVDFPEWLVPDAATLYQELPTDDEDADEELVEDARE